MKKKTVLNVIKRSILLCVVFVILVIPFSVSASAARISPDSVLHWDWDLSLTSNYYYKKYTDYVTRFSGVPTNYKAYFKWGGRFEFFYVSSKAGDLQGGSSDAMPPRFHDYYWSLLKKGQNDNGFSTTAMLRGAQNTQRMHFESGKRYTFYITYRCYFGQRLVDLSLSFGDVWDLTHDSAYKFTSTNLVLFDSITDEGNVGTWTTKYLDFVSPADIYFDVCPFYLVNTGPVPDSSFTTGNENVVRLDVKQWGFSEYLFDDPLGGATGALDDNQSNLGDSVNGIFDSIYEQSGDILSDWVFPLNVADFAYFSQAIIYFNTFFASLIAGLNLNILLRVGLSIGLISVLVGTGVTVVRKFKKGGG